MKSIYLGYVMNLHHLELFHAVALQGSLTQAAIESCTSQSSVSKQLKVFEDSLGVQLFDRLPRGVRMTQAGELLLCHAREIFARRDRALLELHELAGLRRGRLELACSRTVGSYLLPDPLAGFLAAHPELEASVKVANTRHCLEMLRAGQVEAALVEGPAEGEDLDLEVFGRDELVIVASARHPLAAHSRAVPLRRILSQPLVTREPGSGTRAILDRELERHGLVWEPFLELESTEAIKAFVETGTGLAVLSRLAVAKELKAQSLTSLRVPGLRLGRELSLVRLRNRTPGRAFLAFLPCLERCAVL